MRLTQRQWYRLAWIAIIVDLFISVFVDLNVFTAVAVVLLCVGMLMLRRKI